MDKSKKNIFLRIFIVLLYMVAAFPWLIVFLLSKLKININAKITIVFTVMYTIIMTIFIIILIYTLENKVSDTQEYSNRIKILSFIYLYVVVIFIGATGAFASQYVLSPIRKLTEQIDAISPEYLTVRVDEKDIGQDELRVLAKQINSTLDIMQSSLDRQNNFVSDAGHEFKTPISVIKANADMLIRWGKDDKKTLDYSLQIIYKEANNLQLITEQLLNLANIGTFSPQINAVDICTLLKTLVESYETMVAQVFVLDLPFEKYIIKTDQQLMLQALRAIVDNAIKYSVNESKITIGYHVSVNWVDIYVLDTGIGIAQENINKIFDRFFRVDKARDRTMGNTGLGLSITKSIVDILGAKILVTSVLGSGSRFAVRFDITGTMNNK